MIRSDLSVGHLRRLAGAVRCNGGTELIFKANASEDLTGAIERLASLMTENPKPS